MEFNRFSRSVLHKKRISQGENRSYRAQVNEKVTKSEIVMQATTNA